MLRLWWLSPPKRGRRIFRRTILSFAHARPASNNCFYLTSQSPFAVILESRELSPIVVTEDLIQMLVKDIHGIGPTSSDFASAVSDFQRCLSQMTCCYRRQSNSTMTKYNTCSDHTESTQCYVCQLAANRRSALHVFVHTQQYQEHINNAYSLEIDRKQSPLLF
jgi:hypothetical protein